MRKHPILNELPTSRDYIDTFGGYNHNLRIGANEFYDMKNLSSDNYPLLSTRKARCYGSFPELEGITFVGLVTITTNGVFPVYLNTSTRVLFWYVGGLLVKIGVTQYDASYERYSVVMGAYTIIFPDRYYINTSIGGDWKSIDTVFQSIVVDNTDYNYLGFAFRDSEGRAMNIKATFNSKTSGNEFLATAEKVCGVKDGYYYTDSHTGLFYFWNEQNDIWMTQEAYIAVFDYNTKLNDIFKVGDGIRFVIPNVDTGVEGDCTKEIIADLFDNNLNRSFVVKSFNEFANYSEMIITFNPVRVSKEIYAANATLTIEKKAPEMDFVIENENRLWGCRCGKNLYGEDVNEIYASALGDMTNWFVYNGTSQDSYAVSVGSVGGFTGAISYMGNPLFFKEKCIHTIVGSYPATYQMQTTECNGVKTGCDKSLAIINGILFYKNKGGVSAYTGSLPTEIGLPLNEKSNQYTDACAGVDNGKYYLSLKDNDSRVLFVYDAAKGLWHKEDNLSIDGFYKVPSCDSLVCTVGKDLWLLNSDKSIGMTPVQSWSKESAVPWYAETGIITCSTPNRKYVSRVSIRLSVDVGTRVYVSIEYNSSGVWEQVAAITGTTLNAFTFPVKPKRCDHFRLKIEGTDSAKIYSISKTIEQGSDV